jgi:hypothetical protein
MDYDLISQALENAVKWAGPRLIPASELRVDIKEDHANGKFIVYILHNGDVVEEQIYEVLHKL